MAHVVGIPGGSAAKRVVGAALIVGWLMFGVAIPVMYAVSQSARDFGFAGPLITVGVLAVLTWWRRADVAENFEFIADSPSWLRGARGEYLVHQELLGLSDEYIVFHDFHPIGKDGQPSAWNVDHIVVGPTGVFVLDAKNYSSATVRSANKSSFTAKNVRQVQRNALELKDKLLVWSANALVGLYVVPVVVYVQEGARLESLREGGVRTLPLRLLLGEIQNHTEAMIDHDRAKRVAAALFAQIGHEDKLRFQHQLDAFSQRMRAGAAVKASAGHASTPIVSVAPPSVCPKCGGRLIRKVARKGDRVGKEFLGCENFRATGCTYGYNLD